MIIALVAASFAAGPGDSVVSLTVTWQGWETAQPWSKTSPAQRTGNATVVVGPKGQPHLLTTASAVLNATLVRVTKNGEPNEIPARVVRLDREANLALLAVDEPTFFRDLQPVRVDVRPFASGDVTVARWRGNQLETVAGTVSRSVAIDSPTGMLDVLALRVVSDVTGAGAAEPVFRGKSLVGVATSQSGSDLTVLTAPFVAGWLADAAKDAPVRWASALGAGLQEIRSPTLAAWLHLDRPRGVLVTRIAQGSPACGALRSGDVLLRVDGQELDGEGNVRDPVYGLVYFEHLLARHHVGDLLPVQVVRDGTTLDTTVPLRPYDGSSLLLPIDRVGPPPYLVAGGLVFREFDESLQARSVELRIVSQLRRTAQSADRRRVVVLSSVLPDTYNLGYHGTSELEVERVNGQLVDGLEAVRAAFGAPKDGFHVVTFAPNPRLRQLVLDASTFAEAGERIAASYGIPETWRPSEPLPDLGPACE